MEKTKMKQRWAVVVAVALSAVAWVSSCGSCARSPVSPEMQLRDAAISAHKAAATELQLRVDLARVQLAAAPAPRQALAGVDLGRLVEAVRAYVEAVRAGDYQRGLVPALREAATQYEAIRLVFPMLPPLPPVVAELLIVEDCEAGS